MAKKFGFKSRGGKKKQRIRADHGLTTKHKNMKKVRQRQRREAREFREAVIEQTVQLEESGQMADEVGDVQTANEKQKAVELMSDALSAPTIKVNTKDGKKRK